MYKHVLSFIAIGLVLTACGDPNVASAPNRAERAYYDFFNDIRMEMAEMEADFTRLQGFTRETRVFLEDKESQKLYKLAGMYFEKNLDKSRGAYNYADRFDANGCVIHIIIYPPDQEQVWYAVQGINKGKGKQVGKNFVYYQVFTAQPTDVLMEKTINQIIEYNIEKHAATIGQ